MHKPKRPVIGITPPQGKKPRLELDPARSEDFRPSWRLSKLDIEGPWGWSKVDEATLRRLHRVLSHYEASTWGELAGNRNNHCGPMSVDKLEPAARKRLQEIAQDDVEDLFKLKADHLGRVWGIKDRNILYLLWWDPKHTVYLTGGER